ncbi:MAG: hypothetical protein K6F87_01750 [Lachnospiraceae bacterium]|nr:hypothetical protein [Lachnospiraceae bacterium]
MDNTENTEIIENEDTKDIMCDMIANDTPKESSEEISEEDVKSGKNYPTQVVLTIRTIVGVYVAYLAYQIITSKEEIPPLMWVPIVIFIVAGAALVITSIKHFVCGEYEGGKKDV